MQKADIIPQKKLIYNSHCKNPGNIRLEDVFHLRLQKTS